MPVDISYHSYKNIKDEMFCEAQANDICKVLIEKMVQSLPFD